MRSSTGSRSFWASSGSRSTSSSVEPLMSANSTVTCLRSPSRAILEVRILSARCWGGYCLGEAKRGSSARGFWGRPHWGQNLASDDTRLPQVAQACPTGAAHCSQNLASAGVSWPQLGHLIAPSGERGELDAQAYRRA